MVTLEIQYKDQLKIIRFKKLPSCFFLRRFDREQFIQYMNIDSYESKHEDFLNSTKIFRIQSQNLLRIFKVSKILYFFSREYMIYAYKIYLYIIAVVLNLLFLIFWSYENNDFYNHRGDARIPIYVFSITNIVLSFIFLIVWMLLKIKPKIKINQEEYKI